MPTDIRPELSEKNQYHISRHRYYELKHFVMQYPEWKEKIRNIDSLVRATNNGGVQITHFADPTFKAVEFREQYDRNIVICNEAITAVYPENYIIGNCILLAILENKSYDKMRAKYDIPISKDEWYQLYRKFFWLLDKTKK